MIAEAIHDGAFLLPWLLDFHRLGEDGARNLAAAYHPHQDDAS